MGHNLCHVHYAVEFVHKHQGAAATVAKQYNVPGSYVLGLSARESGYGTKHFARDGQAFFNLEIKLPKGKTPVNLPPLSTGYIQAGEETIVKRKHGSPLHLVTFVYTYNNFSDSAISFMMKYGKYVNGSTTPKAFLESLQKGGFNTEDKKFSNPEVLEEVATRIQCP